MNVRGWRYNRVTTITTNSNSNNSHTQQDSLNIQYKNSNELN